MRLMSLEGSIKKSSARTTRSPLELRMTMEASNATSAGAASEGVTATQRLAPNRQCSRFMASGASA